MLLALSTGLGSWALGYPFLTTHTAHLTLPLLGEIHVPSAAVFDAGVFAVVVGSTVLMLTALAHQSLRARRQQAAAADHADDGQDEGVAWKS
jgi:multicomponent K+:H+ antiporter subunit A